MNDLQLIFLWLIKFVMVCIFYLGRIGLCEVITIIAEGKNCKRPHSLW